MSVREIFFGLVIAVTGALCVLVTLQSERSEPERHARIVGTLRELSALNSTIDSTMLASRSNLDPSYDALVAATVALEGTLASLTASGSQGDGNHLPSGLPLQYEVEELLGAKLERVEQFKSHNALLRNSTRYLPVAAADAVADLPPSAKQGARSVAVYRLLSAVLAAAPSGSRRDPTPSAPCLPPDAGQPVTPRSLAVFCEHVTLMARERLITDDLVRRILAPSASQAITALHASYLDLHEAQLQAEAREGKTILAVWSAWIAIVVGWVIMRLRHAKFAAESGSRAKSDFLANVSHEIRTPLNGVVGMTELLLDADLAPPEKELVETLRDSSLVLMNTINDVLDLSKIEAGGLELERAAFDLVTCLEHVQRILSPRARTKNLKLELCIDGDVPRRVVGDAVRVQQVIMNLVANALKFTATGGVTIAVRTGEGPADSSRLGFEVRDTGIGIAPEQLSLIFEKFTQADTSTTRRFGGTGLGLAIARQLVELMGGSLSVASRVGQGSVFGFEIDVGLASTLVPMVEQAVAQRVDSARILVAEDNLVNQRVVVRMLEKMGCQVDLASNGTEAVERSRNGHYDLIFMDCQMPELSGFEATREIRRTEGPGEHIPIVALTANALKEDRQRCLDAGMDDYMTKPIRREVLAAMVSRFAAGPSGTAGP